jgi:streptogramin lyase
VAQLTTAGVVIEFPTPTADAIPDGITVGSDHNVWFTEVGPSGVGRITGIPFVAPTTTTTAPATTTTATATPAAATAATPSFTG